MNPTTEMSCTRSCRAGIVPSTHRSGLRCSVGSAVVMTASSGVFYGRLGNPSSAGRRIAAGGGAGTDAG